MEKLLDVNPGMSLTFLGRNGESGVGSGGLGEEEKVSFLLEELV